MAVGKRKQKGQEYKVILHYRVNVNDTEFSEILSGEREKEKQTKILYCPTLALTVRDFKDSVIILHRDS